MGWLQSLAAHPATSYCFALLFLVLGWKLSATSANLCILVALACLGYAVFRTGPSATHVIERSGYALIVVGVAAIISYRTLWTTGAPSAPEPPKSTIETPALKPTALLADYRLQGLPIPVEAHADLFVLRVSPKADDGFFTYRNQGDKASVWPRPTSKKDKPLGFFATRCILTNHGDATLLNITLYYEQIFRARNSTGGSKGTDPVDSRRRHRIVISALPAKESFAFVMVNTSAKYAELVYPEKASVQVFGEASQRDIDLTRTANNFLDKVALPLGPAMREWPGFPE